MGAPDTYWFAQGRRRPRLSFLDQQGLLHRVQPTQAVGERRDRSMAAQLQGSRDLQPRLALGLPVRWQVQRPRDRGVPPESPLQMLSPSSPCVSLLVYRKEEGMEGKFSSQGANQNQETGE